jgi:ParB-like chromosome segregation protein Spo0J
MIVLNQDYDAAVPVSTLLLHPENPREGDVGAISGSIETLGFFGATICQTSTRYILAGKHRYLAALQNGAEEIPVLWLDVPDDVARRVMLADNRMSDLASYNEPMLAEILQAVAAASGTLDGTGYTEEDLNELLQQANYNGEPPASRGDQAQPPAEAPPSQREPGQQQSSSQDPQYAVVVICGSQVEQEALCSRLMAEGFNCRIA